MREYSNTEYLGRFLERSSMPLKQTGSKPIQANRLKFGKSTPKIGRPSPQFTKIKTRQARSTEFFSIG
jgi:hypothetical protein